MIELSCKSAWTALRQSCTTSIAGPAHGRAHGKVSGALVRKVFECGWRPTVSTDAEAEEFRQFLDQEKIAAEDRVIRRIASRGSATEGVAVTRADLVPEVTITAEGA